MKSLRIAAGLGFYGDSWQPIKASIERGNFGGDWRSIPDLAHVGYPIAEVWENGDAVISKAPGTGGRVSFDTLREQLLYEVHDPAHYLTPDVDADMTTLHMEEIGPAQVIKATRQISPSSPPIEQPMISCCAKSPRSVCAPTSTVSSQATSNGLRCPTSSR